MIRKIIKENKYEFLIFGLIQHLFIGIFLTDLPFYSSVIWPINMIILSISGMMIFENKSKVQIGISIVFSFLVFILPILLQLVSDDLQLLIWLSGIYVLFFVYVLWEVMRYLMKPSYINKDIISAAGCGIFLLIEIAVFQMQTLYYIDSSSFSGIANENPASIYIDFVYFSSITITSIGYGDILPCSHSAKLFTSFFGIIGQFYTVILVGVLISKFTSKNK